MSEVIRGTLVRARPLAASLLALIAVACSPIGGQTASPVAPPGPAATPASSAALPSSAPSPEGQTYSNPVYARDFPDPHVILASDGSYYAYATNGGTTNLPVLRSADLARWERIGDALPALPRWAKPNFGFTWAPGVMEIGDRFVLWFVARDAGSDRQCIGVATSDSPEGPFADDRDEPFICQADLGGSIDPYPFRDEDGRLLVYWKNDGNCCAKPVGLWVQPLADDGLELQGEPVELIRRDQPWEIPLIENPAMVRDGDAYYLFYSANWWESHEYAVGYAVCETATGPCEKPLDAPVFQFTTEVMGPGGQAFFSDADDQVWMAYHAWTAPDVGYPAGSRSLRIERARFENGAPVISGPTTGPQPLNGGD